MPRFYNIVRPSTNKAAAPATETKGGKSPSAPPEKDQKKKEEAGGQ